jgi:hypothetical protein
MELSRLSSSISERRGREYNHTGKGVSHWQIREPYELEVHSFFIIDLHIWAQTLGATINRRHSAERAVGVVDSSEPQTYSGWYKECNSFTTHVLATEHSHSARRASRSRNRQVPQWTTRWLHGLDLLICKTQTLSTHVERLT